MSTALDHDRPTRERGYTASMHVRDGLVRRVWDKPLDDLDRGAEVLLFRSKKKKKKKGLLFLV